MAHNVCTKSDSSVDGGRIRQATAVLPPQTNENNYEILPPCPSSPPPPYPPLPQSERRLSVEEDYLYEQVTCRLAQQKKQTKQLSPVSPVPPRPPLPSSSGRSSREATGCREPPPPYSCSVHIEAVFMMKLEVENATKRAEDRRWHQVYAILHGTILNIYRPKKNWGWGKKTDTSRYTEGGCEDLGGPRLGEGAGASRPLQSGRSEDNPLSVGAGKLLKRYGLQHSDVGIASDYRKRRYVLRVRSDSDQFLLSCLELDTFICWLDRLFAAIDIAAPIDDRDFPHDQSIPRVQRVRWLRGESSIQSHSNQSQGPRSSSNGSSSNPHHQNHNQNQPRHPQQPHPQPRQQPPTRYSATSSGTAGALARAAGAERRGPILTSTGEVYEPRTSVDNRASMVLNFSPEGKWMPRHAWTRRHDMLYAKLCYGTLLFRSPRKSSYVIMRGDQWYVDWPTGRIARVRPPEYREVEVGGPGYETVIGNSRI